MKLTDEQKRRLTDVTTAITMTPCTEDNSGHWMVGYDDRVRVTCTRCRRVWENWDEYVYDDSHP